MTRDTVKIATWAGGYELHRVLTNAYSYLGVGDPINPMSLIFMICKDDTNPSWKYWFRVWKNKDGSRYVTNALPAGPTIDSQIFTDKEPRQVLMSAIVDVLEIHIRAHSSSASSRNKLDCGLLPRMVNVGFFSSAQSEDHYLTVLGEKLIHESADLLADLHLPEKRGLHSWEEERLGKIRKNYQHQAVAMLQFMNHTMHALPVMQKIESAPRMWTPMAGRFDEAKSRILGTDWYVVLELSFLPEPSWSVFIRENSRLRPPVEGLMLAKNVSSLLGALVQAGIILEDSKDSLSDWIGAHNMPEPETVIVDKEPYLLLNAGFPFFLPNKEFLLWTEAVLQGPA